MDNKTKNPWAEIDNAPDFEIDPATLGIYTHINQELDDREAKIGGGNRASASGSCTRKIWFSNQGKKGELMAPRAILNFTLGDLTEAVVTSFIKAALVGEGKLYKAVDFGDKVGEVMIQNRLIEAYSQKTVTTKITEDIEIPGHADGWGQLQNGDWELIEVKSASSYGFKSFEDEGPGDYLYQAHCLMMSEEAQAMNVKQVRFFYIKKDTGHLATRAFPLDLEMVHKVRERFILANHEEMPGRDFHPEKEMMRKKPTGKWKLPWQCGYCGFKDECYPKIRKEFKNVFGAQKPVFYVEES